MWFSSSNEEAKMTRCIVTTVIMSVSLSLVAADFYSKKYDEYDIRPLLENDKILLNYIKCFLDQGPCTPDAKDFKKVIPEALESNCSKCSPKQKKLIKTVVKAVIEKQPEAWTQLTEKFDKEGKYREEFKSFLQESD